MSTSRNRHGEDLFNAKHTDRPRPEQGDHAGPASGKSANHRGIPGPPRPQGNDRRAVAHDGIEGTADTSLKSREATSHRGAGSSQYSPRAYQPRKVPAGTSIFAPNETPKAGPVHSGRTPAAPIEREIKAAEKRGKPSASWGHKRERPPTRSAVTGRSGHRLPSELPSEAEPIRYTH